MNTLFAKQSEDLRKSLENMEEFHNQVEAVGEHLREAFLKNKTAFVAGNGGSASQAQHLSDEMVGRYKANRAPLPVISLTTDGAVLTCIGNDFGYDQIFTRQIEALGHEGDVFIALSTSGTSSNIIAAAEKAHEVGMTVIALTADKGELKDIADFAIISPATETARIQELHLHAIHLLCEMFEPTV